MREITTTLKIDKYGRIIVPEYIRERLGLKSDDLVEVTLKTLEINN
jgi:AbrB family looped-hinge helix DNA binding protein